MTKFLRGASADTIDAVGKFDCIFRNLRNQRVKIPNSPPYLYTTFQLSSMLAFTHTNSPFYRYGPDLYNNYPIYDDIVLFFSDNLVCKHKENPIWSVYGTFKVVPLPYYQLFTLSFVIHHHVFPAIFALLKSKKESTYLNLLNLVKIMIGECHPIIIKTDFEFAIIKSLKTFFPSARVSGCQFHLGQALLRKIQEEKIFNFYNNSYLCRKYLKCLMGLSNVKFNQICVSFNLLISQPDFPPALLSIYTYF